MVLKEFFKKVKRMFQLNKKDRRTIDEMQLQAYAREAQFCVKIFALMFRGVLILDEVDLILHPLKSELNWPLGEKEPIDFTQSMAA